MTNAREAVALWADVLANDGRAMPDPRSLAEIRADPGAADGVAAYMVALIPLERRMLSAAQ